MCLKICESVLQVLLCIHYVIHTARGGGAGYEASIIL